MSKNENVSLNVENNVQAPAPATAPATVTQQEEPAQLTLTVLLNVKNIVDLAIARGTFRGEELSKVGSIYDNFVNGLKTLQTQNELNKIEDN